MDSIQLSFSLEPVKVCTRCEQTKPLSEFHKHRRAKDGHSERCRTCGTIAAASWRKAHLEQARARDRQRGPARRAAKHEAYVKHYQEHREEILRKNREKQKAKRAADPEVFRRYKREAYHRDPAAHQAIDRRYRRNHKDMNTSFKARRRAREKGAKGRHTVQEWEQLKARYQHQCVCCKRGEPDIHLCRDHVVPLSRGGSDYIANIQPLCRSCNSTKRSQSIDYRY